MCFYYTSHVSMLVMQTSLFFSLILLLLLFQLFLDLQLIGGEHYTASLVHTHDTDLRATMNMAVGNGVIAAGQDGACCVMKYKRSTQEEETKATAKEGEAFY